LRVSVASSILVDVSTDDSAPDTVHTITAGPAIHVRTTRSTDGVLRFDLGAELGRGGMGRVVAAIDTALDREVAIKQAHGDGAYDLARFEREARITARLEHPSIVPIHDIGRDPTGRPYYIMRRIEGEPLNARIDRLRRFDERLALVSRLFAAVEAAAFAHARGVIHRDIKPQNILLGEYGETLLIDWGLARKIDETTEDVSVGEGGVDGLTLAGHVMGTPGYMSPEQARGAPVDARTDVYSLGVTLWHLLSGVPPLDGDKIAWLAQMARGDVPLAPLDPTVPRELSAIVVRSTTRFEDRYPDAAAMASDLRAFLDGRLVGAHHYSTWERLRRWVHHHRVTVAVAGVALAVVVTTMSFAVARVVEARDRAERARRESSDRADRLLLERADQSASTDPPAALAALRELAPDSVHLARARDLATIAASNGVGFGMQPHRGRITGLALAPDGNSLASAAIDGTIQLHDLRSRTSRVLARDVTVMNVMGRAELGWTDDGKTVFYRNDHARLYVVDVASGRARDLARAPDAIAVGDDRLRYLDLDTSEVIEHRLHNDVRSVIARDVTDVALARDVVVVDGSRGLRSVGVEGERPLLPRSKPVLVMAVSSAADRAAFVIDGEVVEVALGTRQIVGRWSKQTGEVAWALAYRGGHLFAQLSGVGTRMLADAGEVLDPLGARGFAAFSETRRGMLALTDHEMIAGAGAGMHVVPAVGTAIAGHRQSTIVAIGGVDGSLRWWDLDESLPQRFPIRDDAALCGLSETELFVAEGVPQSRVLAISLRDGSSRTISKLDVPPEECDLVGSSFVMWHPQTTLYGVVHAAQLVVASVLTGAVVTVPLDGKTRVDTRTGRMFRPDGPAVREVGGPTRWTAPRTLKGLDVSGNWIGACDEANHLYRIAPDGRMSETASAGVIDYLRIDPHGTLWFGVGSILHRWESARPEIAHTFTAAITALDVARDGVVVSLADNSLWTVDTTGVTRLSVTQPERSSLVVHGDTALGKHGGTVRYFLATRTRQLRRIVPSVKTVRVASDRLVAVQVSIPTPRNLPNAHEIWVYADRVPRDPAALARWISTTTNVRLDTDQASLAWP
jgi:WD40 repeat protein